jgi:hypothetical protein
MRTDKAAESPPRNLSDYWRIDRSSDRSRELASILGGAAAQAELVQHRLSRRGVSSLGHPPPPVVLDPRLLSGFGAPVPSRVVDCLVGRAIRRGRAAHAARSTHPTGRAGVDVRCDRHEFTRCIAPRGIYVSVRLRGCRDVEVTSARWRHACLGRVRANVATGWTHCHRGGHARWLEWRLGGATRTAWNRRTPDAVKEHNQGRGATWTLAMPAPLGLRRHLGWLASFPGA